MRLRIDKKVATPSRRTCGTLAVQHKLFEIDPNFRKRLMALEFTTARRAVTFKALRVGITTIPVVVHVVYNTPSENISKAQIKSQITVLNKDFRAKNPDREKVPNVWNGLVTNPRIRFVLSGITRTKTNVASFDIDDSMKSKATGGKNPWSTSKYLNIWVCTLSNNILGYAQFPCGPSQTDGVVILNTAFGTKGTAAPPFNLGRTTTHEIGHWLNLHHIWGDDYPPSCEDSDSVDDTPNQEGPNYGKPDFPHITCNNGPNGDMFMNYMDYVDDDTMFMFTAQQVARIHATLDGPRKSIGMKKK